MDNQTKDDLKTNALLATGTLTGFALLYWRLEEGLVKVKSLHAYLVFHLVQEYCFMF